MNTTTLLLLVAAGGAAYYLYTKQQSSAASSGSTGTATGTGPSPLAPTAPTTTGVATSTASPLYAQLAASPQGQIAQSEQTWGQLATLLTGVQVPPYLGPDPGRMDTPVELGTWWMYYQQWVNQGMPGAGTELTGLSGVWNV